MKCGLPATVEYAWAGQIRVACVAHANQISTIANAMSCPFNPRLIEATETCPNELSRQEIEEREDQE